MTIKKDEKQELLNKLNVILKKQSLFQQEISQLENQIISLKVEESRQDSSKELASVMQSPVHNTGEKQAVGITSSHKTKSATQEHKKMKESKQINFQFERFIGENLINKIGIIVLIIGVAIGVKYAIDNNLISPVMRIILGYLVGFGLTFFAVRLKKRLTNFSAVLFSGAMAIHYFITYAANAYYDLFPQLVAVVITVLITVLTVMLALYYNRQVIACLGLVGAYIVPYILKEPFSDIIALFSYMVIINTGVLYISMQKLWKPLNYLALAVTWAIFISWISSGNYHDQLPVSMVFLGLFFGIFHLSLLSYKLRLKEKISNLDIIYLMVNSLIMFVIGYAVLETHETAHRYAGLFTFINAVVYLFSAWLAVVAGLKNQKLQLWFTGMAIALVTLTIAIQFNKDVIVVLWCLEAIALFWYGRKMNQSLFESFSYVIFVFTFFVTTSYWTFITQYSYNVVELADMIVPVFNKNFLICLVPIVSFSAFIRIHNKWKIEEGSLAAMARLMASIVPVFLTVTLFFSLFTQISVYWNNQLIISNSELLLNGNWHLEFHRSKIVLSSFKTVWLMNYTFLFAAVGCYIQFRWIRIREINFLILAIAAILTITFLLGTLPHFAKFRHGYLAGYNPMHGSFFLQLSIRYVSYVFFFGLLWAVYRYIIRQLADKHATIAFEIAFSIICIWICSDELINNLALGGSVELYKLGLSILWGVSSMILIVYGIWKNKEHLRITAIVLFGVTLLKLFFYDLTHLKTVPKTIVFIIIGTILLVVSYLYNKYKHNLFGTQNQVD